MPFSSGFYVSTIAYTTVWLLLHFMVQRFGINWSLLFYTGRFILGQQPCAELAVQEHKKKNTAFTYGHYLAKQSACIALTIAIQRQTAPVSNVGRKCNSPKLSKDIHNMLPNCTTLCIMNKTTKQKKNAQSEMYDYDFKTKLKCTTVQTDAARWI